MANEYLQRTPTSTGNRRVWTWSAWIKRANQYTSNAGPILFGAGTSGSNFVDIRLLSDTSNCLEYINYPGSVTHQIRSTPVYRDSGSWMHILISIDTTNYTSIERLKMFINGSRITDFRATGYPSINDISGLINATNLHYIGRSLESSYRYFDGELTDVFFIDGQALTPDVFGFNKPGKGYISVGSTQATDFRAGQWVPKTPRIIKAEINRRGGFGVNGVYLPMNDSNNFGADFHGTPNSIIKLQENLPQPKCRIDGVGDYTGALRDDPFKQYLVLALPFVSGGLQSGFGDYSAAIKGSGSPKTLTNSNVSIGNTASYYGSAGNFTSASSSYITTPRNVSDYNMGSGDFTVEGWVYFKSINTGQYTRFFSIGNGSGGSEEGIIFEIEQSTSILGFYSRDTTINNNLINGPVIVAGQWYHTALCRKSSTVSAYINGVCVGTADIASRTVNFTSNTAVVIGAWENSIGSYTRFTDAYLQDLRVYKGVAKYKGGFDVPRPYTPVGIATWRAVPDTTANNFATWNPLIPSTFTYSNGNLTGTNDGSNTTASTIGVATGRYYAEFLRPSSASFMNNGVGYGDLQNESYTGEGNASFGVFTGNTPQKVWNNGSSVNLPAPFDTAWQSSDIMMIAMDLNNKRVWWGKNGQWTSGASPANGTIPTVSGNGGTEGIGYNVTFDNSRYFVFRQGTSGSNGSIANFGQNPTFSGNTTTGTFTDSNNKGLFKYQPPAGFLALCEDNLPTPAISDPGKHFKTVLYTGDGASGRSITGIGFTPDLVWIKNRNSTTWHVINDSVRGPNRALYSNQTYAENQTASNPVLGSVSSFNSDGFSLAIDPDSNGNNGWNNNGSPMVAWCWRAGAGTTSTNTNGSITSVVSVNQDAGFSIVSYTGSGANSTVGHGLGRAPSLVITKRRDSTGNWLVQHKSAGVGYLLLNSTNAYVGNDSSAWNLTFPTSSVFSISTGISGNMIAYCWTEIEGFSKFGSYSANFSADGPFCYCGFRPAFVMIKRTDSASSWHIADNARNSTNPNQARVWAESPSIEIDDTTNPFDFLSNGFKLRGSGTGTNASGGTYIFAAFAESPFSYSNSK